MLLKKKIKFILQIKVLWMTQKIRLTIYHSGYINQ